MALAPIPSITAASPVAAPQSVTAAKPANSIADGFVNYLEQAQALEQNANQVAMQVASGEITDVHQFTAAAAKAQLSVELAAAVRNRAVDAFNEIMRMQV